MLYIDPEECVSCGACEPECPVQAIYDDVNVPDEWREFIALDADMATRTPQILEKKPPLTGGC